MSQLRIISHSSEPFAGRTQAGNLLANELKQYCGQDVVVLGIPRGGIIVARQVADALNGDLDIVLSHKLGAPGNPELAIGAVCEDGTVFVDQTILSYIGADDSYIEQEKARKLQEINERVKLYRQALAKLALNDRIVIVTDDGVATGATMQAALWAVTHEHPRRIIAALPTGPDETITRLAQDADETICLRTPPFFGALSRFYLDFSQVQDEQIVEILEQENKRRGEKVRH